MRSDLILGYRNDGSYNSNVYNTTACLPVLLVSLVSLSKNASLYAKRASGQLSWVSQGGPFLVCGCKGTAIFWNRQIFSPLFCKKSSKTLTKVNRPADPRARTFLLYYTREKMKLSASLCKEKQFGKAKVRIIIRTFATGFALKRIPHHNKIIHLEHENHFGHRQPPGAFH